MSRSSTAVKAQQANVEALESTEDEGSQEWWDRKKEAIEQWLRLNPLRIGIESDDTVETIQSQMARGDKYPGTRLKCWKHVAIELESVAGSGSYQAAWNDHERMMSQPTPEIPPLDEDGAPIVGSLRPGQLGSARRHSEPDAGEPDAELPPRAESAAAELPPAEVKPAPEPQPEPRPEPQPQPEPQPEPDNEPEQSSDRRPSGVVERSEEWQRRRNEKIEEAKRQKEEAEAKALVKPPRRRKSAEYAGVQSKVAAHIAGGDAPEASGPSSRATGPTQRMSRRASVSSSAPSAAANGGKGAGAKRRPSVRKKAAKKTARRATMTGPVSLLDQVRAELAAAAEPVAEEGSESDAAAVAAEPVAEEGEAAAAAAAAPAEQKDAFEAAEPELRKADEDFAFDPASTEEKGRFKLMDPSNFIMESIYRKRDAKAGCPGVSLLVGKRDDPPHREQTISIVFDRNRFTEEQAREWWNLHKNRFVTST